MSRKSYSLLRILVVGFLGLQSPQLVFPQGIDTPDPEAPSAGKALQITLGRDSPNLGGNIFRDAYISLTLTNAIGIKTGKITTEMSYPIGRGIAFDRAELTSDLEASVATVEIEIAGVEGAGSPPDVEPSGAAVEVEALPEEGAVTTVKVTVSSGSPLPNGIIANLVFKVTKEFTFEEVGTEKHLITLENQVSAWTTDGQEILEVLGEPGGIDLAFAPVVSACLFYMH